MGALELGARNKVNKKKPPKKSDNNELYDLRKYTVVSTDEQGISSKMDMEVPAVDIKQFGSELNFFQEQFPDIDIKEIQLKVGKGKLVVFNEEFEDHVKKAMRVGMKFKGVNGLVKDEGYLKKVLYEGIIPTYVFIGSGVKEYLHVHGADAVVEALGEKKIADYTLKDGLIAYLLYQLWSFVIGVGIAILIFLAVIFVFWYAFKYTEEHGIAARDIRFFIQRTADNSKVREDRFWQERGDKLEYNRKMRLKKEVEEYKKKQGIKD